MRVLVATRHRRIVGGVETYLHTLLPALVAAGAEVALHADHDTADHRVDAGTEIPFLNRLEDARAWRPDIAYLHGLTDPKREDAIAAAVPTVQYIHAYDGLCVSGNKCHSRPRTEPCSRPLGPGCLALYFPRGCGGRNPLTMVTLYRENRRRQASFRRRRRVLAASRHMREELLRNGADPARTAVLPYPATAPVDAMAPAPRPLRHRVLFVGRITALKGWRPLVEALGIASKALNAPLHLTAVGDGDERGAFENAARQAGIPCDFPGFLGRDGVRAAMRDADVLAVPSTWPEPFGLVGVEAGGCGLPAVAFAVGGIPDWLRPGVTGESAPGSPPDAAGLATALVRVLRDPAHWQSLRDGAWRMAQEFTPTHHIEGLMTMLNDVLKERPQR